jgi:hypothetical protein
MTLTLAFWSPWEGTDEEKRDDVLMQIADWAAAEPNVAAYDVQILHQPRTDRPTWWEAEVVLTLKTVPSEQPTLWDAAA